MEFTVDGKSPRRTEIVKTTCQPKWNEDFTVLVTPQSKLLFSVLDHNSFRKDTVIGEKKLDLYQLLTHYNGRCENLELTLDLMSENKQSDSPAKTGELIALLNGLNIELANNINRPGSSFMPLGQTNSDTLPNRSVLNGVRARMRLHGTENVIPTPPRNSMERQNILSSPQNSCANIPNGTTVIILKSNLIKFRSCRCTCG